MKITELIQKLENFKAVNGDLNVIADNYHSGDYVVSDVQLVTDCDLTENGKAAYLNNSIIVDLPV